MRYKQVEVYRGFQIYGPHAGRYFIMGPYNPQERYRPWELVADTVLMLKRMITESLNAGTLLPRGE